MTTAIILLLIILAGTITLLATSEARHNRRHQAWLEELHEVRIAAQEERKELYARIQRYTFPDNQTDADREPRPEPEQFPEIYVMSSGSWHDSLTNTTHLNRGDAVAWRKHLLKSGLPMDHKPDDALINF